ncbi:SAM-dependent methyltransferase [bacterium]|nr:SAM-dependent methyltransferase [bacterium]
MNHKVYLIPNFIGDQNADLLPKNTLDKIHELKVFIVEREKTARAFLKAIDHPCPQPDFIFHELDKHNSYEGFRKFFNDQIKKNNIGLLSEAGLPAIADPGSEVVKYAHKNNCAVVPLAGSSSLFLALTASGMNGQQFTFHGYLPIQKPDKIKALKQLERNARNHTQIFIETPYRNNDMLQCMVDNLASNTIMAFACDLETDNQTIVSGNPSDFKGKSYDLHKRPCVFMIQS